MLTLPAEIPVAAALSIAVSAAAAAIGALFALGLCLQARRELRHMRESFESLLAVQRTEWTGEIERLRSERVGQTDAVPHERKQAMQMFRAGIGPDTVAARLGAPRREMRLTARIFKIITAA